jgi:hypothetical protein
LTALEPSDGSMLGLSGFLSSMFMPCGAAYGRRTASAIRISGDIFGIAARI